MAETFFDPLDMRDTGFRIREDQRERLARVHTRTPQGVEATDFEMPQAPEFEPGGGGLYSTVGDYLRFARMILGSGAMDGVRILEDSTVAAMCGNAMGDLRCRPMKSVAPASSNDIDFIDGMYWGLGFLINPAPLPTGRSAGSLAWGGFANSYFWIDPAKRVAGVYATQLLPFYDAKAVAVFEAFESAVYANL
jgi:CubicO group peptidase (beta-lactamase class C family)